MNRIRDRDSCRIATVIRENLQGALHYRLYEQSARYKDINHTLKNLAHSNALMHRACRLGYRGAAERLVHQVNRFTDHLRRELEGLPMTLASGLCIPTFSQIAGELIQIEDEFGDWEYRPREQLLKVTTDPIQLDDIRLGPFSINVELNVIHRLGNQHGVTGHHPFKVIALEPNTAAGNNHITHPHVSDDRLCTGESTNAVKSALLEGRLADFFLIVRSLLQTYNPDSPYVSLDVWRGTECHECSERVREDDRYYCEDCQHDVCNDCMSSCAACGDSSCYGCLINCKHCEDYHCHGCMKQCSECDQKCCTGCLDEGLCPPCVDYKESQQDDIEDIEEQDQAKPHEYEDATETTPVATPAAI